MMGSPFERNKGASVIVAGSFFFRKENHTMETKEEVTKSEADSKAVAKAAFAFIL